MDMGREHFEPADFFVLRMPAMPLDAIKSVQHRYEETGTTCDAALMNTPQFREALYLASQNLFSKLESGANQDRDNGLALALSRYANRITRRSTPFGAFAGVGVGRIGADTRLEAPSTAEWKRVARIDQAIVAKAQAELLGSSDKVIQGLEVELNTSLWCAHDGYRYVEAARGGSWTHYELSRITSTPAIDAVQELLSGGPMKVRALAATLSERLGSTEASAEAFIADLTHQQFLEYRPRIGVTGDDVVASFVEALAGLADRHPTVEALKSANAILSGSVGIQRPIERYRGAMTALADAFPNADPAKAIQVDLQIPGETLSLSRTFVDEVLRTLERLAPLLSRSHSELSDFATNFERRYGDASIPLLEVMDSDLGLGFGDASKLRTPLLNGIPLGGLTQPARVAFDSTQAFLLGRAQQAVADGQTWIDLTDAEIDKFSDKIAALPSTAGILGVLEKNADGTDSFALSGVFGPPAAILLGRFACGSSELTDCLRRFIEDAETPEDVIVAEFAHLPDGRVGNVILRPVLRQFEIPYLGASGADPASLLPPSDLEVFCRHGIVHLWSRTHGKEVLPRISNAHNNNNALNVPLYRFIGALQRQSEPVFSWQWGPILDSLPFLPGVKYGKVTVARPRWRLYPTETTQLASSDDAQLATLLEKRGIPARVRLRQADNFLELNLECRLDRDLLREEARRHRSLECEAWDERLSSPVAVAGSCHANEVVIPVRSAKPPRRIETPIAIDGRAAHSPGSEWLYASIYCGPTVADHWLAQSFPKWAADAQASGCRDPFFIRYLEGGTHIRLRVAGPVERLWGEVRQSLEASLAPLSESRAVTRLQYGTYFPELARYGGPDSLAACERIFAADSEVTARILTEIDSAKDREAARWQMGFRSLFHLLRAFNLDANTELSLLARYRDAYAKEFNIQASGRNALNAAYRAHRPFFDGVILETTLESDRLFGCRTAAVGAGVSSDALNLSPRHNVIDSLLHMSANRLFPERARAHELAIFHVMHKSLESYLARSRHASGPHAVTSAPPTPIKLDVRRSSHLESAAG